jgi:hypothetical protein
VISRTPQTEDDPPLQKTRRRPIPDRGRHPIPDLLTEARAPASNRGAEEKVQREVAVPSIGGHPCCAEECLRLALIAGGRAREDAAQPRQSRALLTVWIQLLGLAHQPQKQVEI